MPDTHILLANQTSWGVGGVLIVVEVALVVAPGCVAAVTPQSDIILTEAQGAEAVTQKTLKRDPLLDGDPVSKRVAQKD